MNEQPQTPQKTKIGDQEFACIFCFDDGEDRSSEGYPCRHCRHTEYERRRRLESAREQLGVSLMKAELSTLVTRYTPDNRESVHFTNALRTAKSFVDNAEAIIAEGRGLAFIGRPGTGKTTLAAGIKLGLIDRMVINYISEAKLISLIANYFHDKQNSDRLQAVEHFAKLGKCVIIDEVGKTAPNQQVLPYGAANAESVLYDFFDYRYREGLSTIITSNFPLKTFTYTVDGVEKEEAGLDKRYPTDGPRLSDRLLECCTSVPLFDCESFRLDIAKSQLELGMEQPRVVPN